MSMRNRWWSSAMLPALLSSAQAISNQHMSPYSSRWAVWSLKAFILDFISTKHRPPPCLGKNNMGAFTNIVHTKKSIKDFFFFLYNILWTYFLFKYGHLMPPGYYKLGSFPHMTTGEAATLTLYNPLLCHFHTHCGTRNILLTEPFNMYFTLKRQKQLL